MLRIAAIGVLAAVSVSASCGSHYPKGFSDLRACAGSAYSDGACDEDQRSTPITARTFYCSTKLGDRSGMNFTGQWYYEGTFLAKAHHPLPNRKSATAHLMLENVSIGGTRWNGPLPGGRYRCDLTVAGETRSLSFSSAGPRVANLSACRATAALTNGGMCPSDESGSPIRARELTCSALVAARKGEQLRFQLLHNGRGVESTTIGTLPHPLVHTYQPLTNMVPGHWGCRFIVAGKTVALKQFTVAEAM